MNTKRTLRLLSAIMVAILFVVARIPAQPFGQWDFNSSNLTATVGSDLTYADGGGGITALTTVFGSCSAFGIATISGSNAVVMKFPGSTNTTMGFNMPTPPANGGLVFVDNYTLIFDVLFPTASDAKLRSLLQTDDGTVTPAADFVVTSGNQIGAVAVASGGTVTANTWYRVGFVVRTNIFRGYVDGAEVVSGTGAVNRFPLTPNAVALMLGDHTAAISSGGYVNSIQLRDSALTEGEMAALAGAVGGGIPSTIPPVPSFIRAGRTPGVGELNISGFPSINIVLDQGSTTVNGASILLFMDNVQRTNAVVTPSAPTFTITDSVTNLLGAGSTHTLKLVWSDSVVGFKTNTWSFTVVQYQVVKLPSPFYLETFDSVAETAFPTGWYQTNNTETHVAGFDLTNPRSDSYKGWVVITTNTLFTAKGEAPLAVPPILVNGSFLTAMADNKLCYAESDSRSGSQVQMLFATNINCTSRSNVYLSWHSIYGQNQDNIASVEYSVDQGANWLPVLYMLTDGGNEFDIIRTNGVIDVGATLLTARADQAYGTNYGYWIGAPVTAALIPYISGRINDDLVESIRVELVRLPQADNKPNVWLRFMQAGTASWWFGIDNVGMYEIGFPIISGQPQSQTVDAGTPVTFSVVATATPAPSYQWLSNGVAIAGATSSSYTFTAQTNHNGVGYSVVVSNSLDSVTSSSAILTVIAAPRILRQPLSQSANAGVNVGFNVSARGRAPISYQWNKNGSPISGATSTRYLINNAQLANAGDYSCIFSNSDGSITSRVAYLKIVTNITQDLVVHLKFDTDFNDSSGRGNNGTPVGSPTLVAGKVGQCMQYTDADSGADYNYVSLDNPIGTHPADLRMVNNVTFSISFWYRVPVGNRHGDPAIVSNKDWDSGSNLGFVLFNSGSGLRWNFREIDSGVDLNTRKDSGSTSPGIEDGNWHHCVVVFNRGGNAATYVDGNLVNVGALATAAPIQIGGFYASTTIDTDPPTNRLATATGAWNIGEDGSGLYTTVGGGHDGPGISVTNACIDDFGVWRRALTPPEVAAVYTAGNAGNHFETVGAITNPKPLDLAIAISGGNAVITKGNTMLFSAPSLNGPWTEITAARSVSVYNDPLSAGPKYYRNAQP